MHGLLIVDDDIDLAAALAEYLASEGFDTDTAHDGKEALDMLDASDSLPQAILMDIRMPIVGGPEMIKTLGESPAWCGIPVIVVTSVRPEDMPDVGHAQHVLLKPIEMPNLMALLQNYCRRSA